MEQYNKTISIETLIENWLNKEYTYKTFTYDYATKLVTIIGMEKKEE